MTGCDELFNMCAFEFMRGFTNTDSISSMFSMVHDLAVPFQALQEACIGTCRAKGISTQTE